MSTEKRERADAVRSRLGLWAGLCALLLVAPPAAPARGQTPTVVPVLVQAIRTYEFNPPSPDPSGITLLDNGNLLLCDSEVEEIPALFMGFNLFETPLSPTPPNWSALFTTTGAFGFSNEPTGLAANPGTGRVFFSDDVARRIFEIDPGADGAIGTSDDIETSFRTDDFGSQDPEDVAYDPIGNRLYVCDGVGLEIFVVDPGPNGIFDGVPTSVPPGDDVVTSFDLGAFGATDPEGVAYDEVNDTLLVVDRLNKVVYESTTDGILLRIIDTSSAMAGIVVPTGSGPRPSGITIAPGSTSPSARNVWISDRRRDNNQDPNENDGVVYEFFVGPAPTLDAFGPPSGTVGTPVTLSGSGFLGATEVAFNGTPDPGFSVVSDTEISAAVPLGATTGRIRVTNPAGFGESASDFVVIPADCSDGLDNDGDGQIDFPLDPGCSDAADLSERSGLMPCDDGIDNDGDGRNDFDPVTFASPGNSNQPPAGSGDPGCQSPSAPTEKPQCQDGVDNGDGDGLADYDGGFSVTGVPGQPPDPQCVGLPWRSVETAGGGGRCGLGFELALVLPALLWWRRRLRSR